MDTTAITAPDPVGGDMVAPPPSRYPTKPVGLRFMNRVVNPVVRALLRSPLHRLLSGGVLLLTITGRRTGRPYALPAQYRRRGDQVAIVPGIAGRKTWWRNLDGGAPVRLRIRGEVFTGEGEVLTGDAARTALAAIAGPERAPATPPEVVVRVRDLRPQPEPSAERPARSGVG